jgi:hypothetical protein
MLTDNWPIDFRGSPEMSKKDPMYFACNFLKFVV